jgi:hypothetical protein
VEGRKVEEIDEREKMITRMTRKIRKPKKG